MAKKAHSKPPVKDGSRFEGWPPFDRPAAVALDGELAAKLAGLSRFQDELKRCWEQGLTPGRWRNLMMGCCPFCEERIEAPRVGEFSGLTWNCRGGCNP
jgi:hypothetical protein